MEDVSNLPFLPIGVRERAGLLHWSDVYQLWYGLGHISSVGSVPDGILGFFDEPVHPGAWFDSRSSFSASVSLFSNPVDAL